MNIEYRNVEKAIKLLSVGSDPLELDAKVLSDAKVELEQALNELNFLREKFNNEMEAKQKNLDAQNRLFNMKWSLLEDETRRLAEDSAKAEKRKQFFDRVQSYQQSNQRSESTCDNIVNAELFFKGVASPQALRKRYKDLIKIYHPDAESGDKQIVQEINREYATLRHAMAD